MRKSAMVLGLAIVAMPIAVSAEETAKLPRQDSNYLVFLTQDGNLPSQAKQTIATAATTLKYERKVTLEGNPVLVEKVKHELISNGVSPQVIVDQSMDLGLAVSSGDGLDTAPRVVEIKGANRI